MVMKRLIDPSIQNTNYTGMHCIVLVHGFQGSHFDVRVIKNCISVAYPDALLLCSQANENDTDCDVFELGLKLAEET